MPGRHRVKYTGEDHDTAPAGSVVGKWTWAAMLCVFFVASVGDITRGITVVSMLPFVERLGGSTAIYGFVHVCFDIGRFVGCLLFGYWADRRTINEALTVALCCSVVGSVTYSLAPHVAVMVIGRLFVGLGGGTLVLARVYVRHYTNDAQRTRAMAFLSAVQDAGLCLSPGLGALAGLIPMQIGRAAPLMGLGFVVIGIVWVVIAMRKDPVSSERYGQQQKQKAEAQQAPAPAADDAELLQSPPGVWQRYGWPAFWRWVTGDFKRVGVLLFFSLNAVLRSTVAISLAVVPIWLSQWLSEHGVEQLSGIIIVVCGAVSVVLLVGIALVSKWISDIYLLIIGFSVLVIGLLFSVPFRGSEFPYWQIWLATMLVTGIGNPIAHSPVLSSFTKFMPADGREGTYLGMFTSITAACVTVVPLAITGSMEWDKVQGARICYTIVLSFGFVSLVSICLYFWRLSRRPAVRKDVEDTGAGL